MTLHADLCALLQLDHERATEDDVLDLVGGLLDEVDLCTAQRDEANGYDGDTATDVSRETWAPSGGGTPPRVYFEHPMPDRLTASPPGARIRCDLLQDGASSLVTIRTIDGDHIAEVTVHTPLDEDTTTETIAIASAMYWSWWRAQDMRGCAPRRTTYSTWSEDYSTRWSRSGSVEPAVDMMADLLSRRTL